MFSLRVDCTDNDRDVLIAELWEQGSAGILELDDGLQAFFEDAGDSRALTQKFAGYNARVIYDEPHDWVKTSQSVWEPLLVGSRFYLVPQWRSDPAPPGRLRLAINPGLACGSGAHEATQLCLEALERYQRPGTTVVDVGTGSGILSIASALLGAACVIGCDVDSTAIEIAHQNFETAGASACLFIGSLDSVAPQSADLVIANISAEVVAELVPEALRCLRESGIVIASGFESEDVQAVLSSIRRHGGIVQESFTKRTWSAVVYGR
jgi:ribosomal protein L11 methyltransferase